MLSHCFIGIWGKKYDRVDAHLEDHQVHLRRAVLRALPERLGTLVKKGTELRRHRDGLGRIVPESGLVAVVAPEHQPPVGISGLVRLPDSVQVSVHLGLSPGEPLDRRLQRLPAKLRLSHSFISRKRPGGRRPPSASPRHPAVPPGRSPWRSPGGRSHPVPAQSGPSGKSR